MSDELRQKLRRELAEVAWRDLRPHAGRNAVFLVKDGLDLLEAAVAVATDDCDAVAHYIDAGQLTRPTETDLTAWESALDARFAYLIAQPFVLAKRLGE